MLLLGITAGLLAALAPVPDDTPLAPGTITLEQGDAAGATDPAFTDAVNAAIARARFIPLPPPSHSRYVAVIAVTRKAHGVVTSGTKGSAPAAGIGNWGVGLGVQLPTKKDQIRGLVVTQLTVTILLRSDRHPVWNGTAVTAQVDGTRAGAPDAIAAKLADALFAQFPRPLDAPLSVP